MVVCVGKETAWEILENIFKKENGFFYVLYLFFIDRHVKLFSR